MKRVMPNLNYVESRRSKKKTASTDEHRSVTVMWDPHSPATVTRAGEEVSEVRFADGRIRFIPNEQLLRRRRA